MKFLHFQNAGQDFLTSLFMFDLTLYSITLIYLKISSFSVRNFKLYLTTNTDLFTENFKAVFVDKDGREESYDVPRQNYFIGHVVGKKQRASTLIV